MNIVFAIGSNIVAVAAINVARADGLFPYVAPHTCIQAAKVSQEADDVRRFNLAVCLHKVRSPTEAVRALRASGFDVDPVRAQEVEHEERRGEYTKAGWALHHLVVRSNGYGVPSDPSRLKPN